MNISAVLLAGGESQRMGKDKATVLFRGNLLWEVQLDLLRKLEPEEILVSARTDPPWRPDDVQLVTDDPPSRGPLSGLAASLGKMRSAHLLALAIDMPFMSETYLRYLCVEIEAGVGVVPKIDNRAEPLAAIYPQEGVGEVRAALSGTDYSLQTLTSRLVEAGKLRAIPVTEQDKKLFLNVNEVSDLAAL
jgi:molybdenum cofactor guanylyltransferase